MEINRYGAVEDVWMAGRSKRLRAHTDDEARSPRQGDIDVEAENLWLHTETSPEHWVRVGEELQKTNMVVAFAMTETEVEVDRCTWSLRHLTARILERCAQGGVEFVQSRLQSKKGGRMLTGVPVLMNRDLWMLLKQGYLMLDVGAPPASSRSIRVLVRPDYTGKEKSNLTLNEVEYQNCNELQPAELVAMIRQWGGTDVVVVSHTKYQGVEQMWPPTWCMQVAAHSNLITYAFRFFFLSPDEANTVYANYLKATTPRVCRYGNPVDTVELKMVSNVDWDGRRSRLYRTGTDVDTNVCKLMILGLRNEVTHDQLQQLLNQHELQTSSIVIPLSNGRYAEVEFADRTTAETALSRFGRDGQEQLKLGNITLYVKPKRSSKGCHECGEVGHFIANCPTLRHRGSTRSSLDIDVRSRERDHTRPTTELERTSAPSLVVAERMVNNLLDARLHGIHTALDNLTRKSQIADRACRTLEDKVEKMEAANQQLAERAAERAVAMFLEATNSHGSGSGNHHRTGTDEHMTEVESHASHQKF